MHNGLNIYQNKYCKTTLIFVRNATISR